MEYNPPVKNMLAVLKDCAGLFNDQDTEFTPDLAEAVLDEAARLARDVIAPSNVVGDQEGAKLDQKSHDVTLPKAFHEAYKQYQAGGWNALPFPKTYGGQNLPTSLSFAVQEMWQGANLSFGLCPLLNQSAVEALLAHGSEAQKDTYLHKLVSGEWTGTMNLTEPQAGSDLAAIKATAKPDLDKDDVYQLSGQKIYITYGEHDLSENIIHLVLARLPDAPEGVKGISLFVVPKILEDGSRNNVKCIGLEHKLGIHASPTCVMEFDGAEAQLVGAPHTGLKAMFTMMNMARLSVGLQGVAIAERALQLAQYYAQDRVQGFDVTGDNSERVSIDKHGDVQRMLARMQVLTQAGRAMTYYAAGQIDLAHAQKDPKTQARVDILTPLVKAWCTDLAQEVTSLNVQVHGGMGFVEETGAAQLMRDARILPIYEGTNGIQANDLVLRKTLRDQGEMTAEFIEEMLADISNHKTPQQLITALTKLKDAHGVMMQIGQNDMQGLTRRAYPYLELFAIATAGYTLALSSEMAQQTLPTDESVINGFARMIATKAYQFEQEIS